MSTSRKTRVLIVDDSAIVRKILSDALSAEKDIEVVGTAPDPFVARDKILALKPDVLTLDIEMPRMDGLSFLKRLMRFHPLPVIIISSLSQSSSKIAIEALEAGAVEVLGKPDGPYSVGELRQGLAAKIRAAAASKVSRADAAEPAAPVTKPLSPAPLARQSKISMIAIGASTGGTEALQQVLVNMPAVCPPIVIVQHIPPVFSKAFADRLNGICTIHVKEAAAGDKLAPGTALVAPGGFHMLVHRCPQGYQVELNNVMEPECYQRPAVDVLFRSVAALAGPSSIGVILTGMGSDGAQGMAAMKAAGSRTIAQDEATCVVFGMPREAIKLGCVDTVLPLPQIAGGILKSC